MPTAAKLIAALAFAAVAWLAAEAYKPQMPPDTVFGYFTVICTLIGAFCGWKVMGSRAGRGWSTALGIGVTTSTVLTLASIFAFSLQEMLLRSMNRRFGDPMEAAVGTFGIVIEYAALLADVRVLGILVIGGMLGGLAAEFAARRWK